jgi:type I restriction enzyme S subunit
MFGDWVDCLLGDVVALKRGYDLPQQRRTAAGVPIVSSSGVSGYHNEAKVRGPGVVTGRYGTLGEVFYIERDFWPLNTSLYVKDFKGNHPRFISYFLRTLNLGRHNVAGAVPGVNRNALHALPVRIPGGVVQEKIAAILSAYDDLIENNTRRIRTLEAMAQALYREWFVHFRFPGHGKVKMVQSALGQIPAGWKVARLSELADVNAASIKRGAAPVAILYVDISSVSPGRIDKIEPLASADAPGRARRIVKHGDIIWSCVRPNRRSYSLILDPPKDLIVSTGFAVISPKDAPYSYLYHALTTDDFVAYLTNHATGAAYPAVTGTDFENALIVRPARVLLDRFHEMAQPCLALRETLNRKNAILRRTRDLLLPKLISGNVDVSDLDIDVRPLSAV